MEAIHLFCYSILLWTIIGHTNGHQDGASVTSCYNHIIIHSIFNNPPFAVNPCDQDDSCSPLTLTVFCPEQQDTYCCRDFDSNIMYTHCNYIFQWNDATNLGYLVQARLTNSTMFNSNTTIIGIWDTGPDHKPLYCNSSSTSMDGPFPNSVTQSRIFTESDPNIPDSINMTWTTNTTITADQLVEQSIFITFFYTIARDISTNFLPYTRDNLFFTLRPHPVILAETTTKGPATTTSTLETTTSTLETTTSTLEATTSAACKMSCLVSGYAGVAFALLQSLYSLLAM